MLAVQEAQGGRLQALQGQPGLYRLTLLQTGPELLAFTDRPERKAGYVGVETWNKLFGKGQAFAKDAPNAALVVRDNANQRHSYAVELVKASYNTTTRQQTYDIRFLKPIHIAAVITSFTDADLFVDSFWDDLSDWLEIAAGN